MSDIRLSKTSVSTFRGNVVSLRLLSRHDISKRDIQWISSDESVVLLRTFQGAGEDSFSDGVLLVALACGSAEVSAILDGEVYTCPVSIREMRAASEQDAYHHYFGDFHAHTSEIHARNEFLTRTDTHAIDAFSQAKEEGYFDTFVVSDHAVLVNDKEFFSVFLAAEATDCPDFIPFSGEECDVTIIEKDAYGRPHQNSGEVVTFNTAGYVAAKSWEEYFENTSQNPLTIGSFAHPQVLGWSTPGIWDFQLPVKTTPEMLARFHMIEMGNGSGRDQNLIHERVYSVALDCGYRIAPVSTSDCHSTPWGSGSLPGRTVILAPEKSREMFLDAMLNARLYATENGLVKLWYTVNGCMPASTLPPAEDYHFHVDLSYFSPPAEAQKTVLIEVVSDYGEVIHSLSVDPADSLSLDFTVHSDTARYFFLRIHAANGDRTWSPAVWTGRAFDPCPAPAPAGTPVAKEEMQVIACTPGDDPKLLISGNPDAPWLSDSTSAEFVLDLGRERSVCAIGLWPHIVQHNDPALPEAVSCARFISSAECYLSCDGQRFTKAAEGLVRGHGGEYRLSFDAQCARYVKVVVPYSTGSASRKVHFQKEPVMVAEADVYEMQ